MTLFSFPVVLTADKVLKVGFIANAELYLCTMTEHWEGWTVWFYVAAWKKHKLEIAECFLMEV